MDISVITSGSGGYTAGAARYEAAANRATSPGRPDTDYAVPTPGQRVDGIVSSAASVKDVAMNLELLANSMEAQRYVIDLLA